MCLSRTSAISHKGHTTMAPLFDHDCPAKTIGTRNRCNELPGSVALRSSLISYDVVENECVTGRYLSEGVDAPGIEINR